MIFTETTVRENSCFFLKDSFRFILYMFGYMVILFFKRIGSSILPYPSNVKYLLNF